MNESHLSHEGRAEAPGDLLSANLDALGARHADLAEAMRRTAASPTVCVAAARSGVPAMKVTVGERTVSLASSYDPLREAARLVDACDTRSADCIFVKGFALGYHVGELLRRAQPRSRVFVLEARPEVFRAALEARDLRGILTDERVHFLVGLDKPALISALTPFATPILVGSRMLRHRPSIDAFGDDYARLEADLNDFITFARTCLATTVSISRESRENAMTNVDWYCFAAGINDLKDLYRGFPAVIAAAGPSLQRNIDLLHRVKGRGVLITMSTTLKPLLSRGIVPDYACMIDYAWLSRKYFALPDDSPPVTMVAQATADWRTLDAHRGPKLLMRDPYLTDVLGDVAPHKDALRSGATVAHAAFYFAEYLGADPIVFVGQDLSFPDGITYTPGTASHDLWQLDTNRFQTLEMKEWERICRMRSRLFRVKDSRGGEVYTDQQMFTYLQQFERDFAASDRTIVDATEGGAAKRGTVVMTLAEAIEKYFTRELPDETVRLANRPRGGMLDESARPAVRERLTERARDAQDIRNFYERSLGILEMIRDNLDDAGRAAEFQGEVDRLRAEIAKRRQVNHLVSQIVQHDEYLKLQRDREIAGEDLCGDERRRRQIERDIAYITSLRDGAEELLRLVNVARARVEAGARRSAESGVSA